MKYVPVYDARAVYDALNQSIKNSLAHGKAISY